MTIYPLGRHPTISTSSTNSWPSDRLVVSLITGQGHFTFLYKHTRHNIHNREEEEKTNNQGLRLALSARKENFVSFLRSFQWAIRVKFPHNHEEYWLILSRWPNRPLGPKIRGPRLAAASPLLLIDWSLLLIAFFSSLSWDLAFPHLLPVSWEISRASPLWEFRAKIDQGDPLTGTHPHSQKRMPPIVTQLTMSFFLSLSCQHLNNLF